MVFYLGLCLGYVRRNLLTVVYVCMYGNILWVKGLGLYCKTLVDNSMGGKKDGTGGRITVGPEKRNDGLTGINGI